VEQPAAAIVQAAPAEPALPRPASSASLLIARSELPVAAVPAIDDQPTAGDGARDVAIGAGMIAPERRAASLAERSPAAQPSAPTPPAAHPAPSPWPSADQPPATATHPVKVQPSLPPAPASTPPHLEQVPTSVARPDRQEQGEALRETMIERIAEREQRARASQIVEAGAGQRMAPAPPAAPWHEQAAPAISAATQPTGGAQLEINDWRPPALAPTEQLVVMPPSIRPAIRKLDQQLSDQHGAIERADGSGKPDYAVESPAPTVHVTIGRIEVRATPAPPAPASKPRATPAMTLEEYLQRRATGGQR
jgi:hypothetical protein